MEESLVPSPPPGPAELCVGDCSADFRTQSEQLYSFVVCGLPVPFPSQAFSLLYLRECGVANGWGWLLPPLKGCFFPRPQHLTV